MWLKHRIKTEELNVSAVPHVFGVIWAADLSAAPLAHQYHQPTWALLTVLHFLGH